MPRYMSRKIPMVIATLLAIALLPNIVFAHCQVPCGIYDDAARIAHMYEDAATIEKAMVQMQDLAGKTDAQSANQLTRWIMTKEAHASNIITTVSEYFLTQKVKPVAADDEGHATFLLKLEDHHRVMNAAMKAKQKSDPEVVGALRAALDQMGKHYDLKHSHE
ncbi:MAG: superoxide dismutase [Candidatus Krumholzibacteria bacterium]|nr:superoxide dismutase [Candidatus Krumholzibacteria bacterium]